MMKISLSIIFLTFVVNFVCSQDFEIKNNGAYLESGDYLFCGTNGIYSNDYGIKIAQGGSLSVIDFHSTLHIRAKNYNHAPRLTMYASNGYIGLGRSPSYRLDVNGSIRVNSTIYSSDERLKRNVAPLDQALGRLTSLNSFSYNWIESESSPDVGIGASSGSRGIEDSSADTVNSEVQVVNMEELNPDVKSFGFMAQEFREVFPELVYEDKDGVLGIDYTSLVPVLVEAIKELNMKVEALNEELEKVKKSK